MNNWERQYRLAQEYKEAYPPGTRLMLLSIFELNIAKHKMSYSLTMASAFF